MHLSKEKEKLLQVMQEAGAAILRWQQVGFSIETKANNDIVTKADIEADEILKAGLLSAFPQDGWLSEETSDNADRLSCKRVWVVDPIDGTREFATGVPEYAVSVALVEEGKPILASVFNPATKELFFAVKGEGAWLNNQKLSCDLPLGEKLILLASQSEYRRGEWNQFASQHTVKPVGSIAYKLALVAAGRAHATFSLGPKSEWDVAAGVLLVSESGGIVTNKLQQEIVFNQPNVRLNGIVASASKVNKQLFDLIQVSS